MQKVKIWSAYAVVVLFVLFAVGVFGKLAYALINSKSIRAENEITQYVQLKCPKSFKVKSFTNEEVSFLHNVIQAEFTVSRKHIEEFKKQFVHNYWRDCDGSDIPACNVFKNINAGENFGYYKRVVPVNNDRSAVTYVLIKQDRTQSRYRVYLSYDAYVPKESIG